MQNKSKIYKKNCPNCKTEQNYSNKYKLNRAIKNNVKCIKCSAQCRPKRSEIHKKRLSEAAKARKLSEETKNKISIGNTGKIRTKHALVRYRVSTIKRISDSKNNGNQFYPNYNTSSISIIEQKAKELGITDLQHAENGGEFYIKELGYWVDGYSQKKNVVIEYYETFHKRQSKKDKQRQREITDLLKCEFIIIRE